MTRTLLIIGAAILLLAAAGLGAYGFSQQDRELGRLRAELDAARTDAASAAEASATTLAQKADENARLAAELRNAKDTNASFTGQISRLSGTVGALEKLAKTDPELLAKYSKVYFLNENYVPSALAVIDSAYAFQPGRTYEIHASADRFLEDLLGDAKEDGLSLLIASSYRSFANQASLKSGYTVRYGTGANAFSADQGYSEHQLGTAVDFTTPSVGGTFAGFDTTREYAWLEGHAWKYGFILSYPKGNTYYQYEPWHWRFVGRDLATRLHEDDEHFYDLDQRTIDGYLGELFD